MNDPNPFQPPVQATQPEAWRNSHSIVSSWERMRIFYNLILGASGLVVLVLYILLRPELALESIALSVMFGLFANLCFCAGPGFELYLCYFWKLPEYPRARVPLFIMGTLLSCSPIGISGLALLLVWF